MYFMTSQHRESRGRGDTLTQAYLFKFLSFFFNIINFKILTQMLLDFELCTLAFLFEWILTLCSH